MKQGYERKRIYLSTNLSCQILAESDQFFQKIPARLELVTSVDLHRRVAILPNRLGGGETQAGGLS